MAIIFDFLLLGFTYVILKHALSFPPPPLPPSSLPPPPSPSPSQYFYYSAIVAIISTAVFIRLNWIIRSLLNLIALVIYLIVILYIQSCLFDNYDKRLRDVSP